MPEGRKGKVCYLLRSSKKSKKKAKQKKLANYVLSEIISRQSKICVLASRRSKVVCPSSIAYDDIKKLLGHVG